MERPWTQIMFGQNRIGRDVLWALDGSDVLGYLELADPRPGLDGRLVSHIETHPHHRRKGIATALWFEAKRLGLNPIHAIDKTNDGTAWAEAVGH